MTSDMKDLKTRLQVLYELYEEGRRESPDHMDRAFQLMASNQTVRRRWRVRRKRCGIVLDVRNKSRVWLDSENGSSRRRKPVKKQTPASKGKVRKRLGYMLGLKEKLSKKESARVDGQVAYISGKLKPLEQDKNTGIVNVIVNTPGNPTQCFPLPSDGQIRHVISEIETRLTIPAHVQRLRHQGRPVKSDTKIGQLAAQTGDLNLLLLDGHLKGGMGPAVADKEMGRLLKKLNYQCGRLHLEVEDLPEDADQVDSLFHAISQQLNRDPEEQEDFYDWEDVEEGLDREHPSLMEHICDKYRVSLCVVNPKGELQLHHPTDEDNLRNETLLLGKIRDGSYRSLKEKDLLNKERTIVRRYIRWFRSATPAIFSHLHQPMKIDMLHTYADIELCEEPSEAQEKIKKLQMLKKRDNASNIMALPAKDVDQKMYQYKKIKETDIFLELKNKQKPRVIVLEGEGGAGKTTLVQRWCYMWATRLAPSFLQQFKLIITLPCSELTSTVEQGIKDFFPSNRSRQMYEYLEENDKSCLVILEALDEIHNSEVMKSVKEFIQGRILPNVKILITTRPDQKNIQKKEIDRLLRINGFLEGQVRVHCEKYLSYGVSSMDGEQEAWLDITDRETIIATLMDKIPIERLRNPLLCNLALHIAAVDIEKLESITLTKLYEEYIDILIQKSENVHNHAQAKEIMARIEKIALWMCITRREYVSDEDLRQMNVDKYDRLLSAVLKEHLILTGHRETSSYTFSHEQIKEYLAAKALSKTLEVQRQSIIIILAKYQYIGVLRFAAGILKTCSSLSNIMNSDFFTNPVLIKHLKYQESNMEMETDGLNCSKLHCLLLEKMMKIAHERGKIMEDLCFYGVYDNVLQEILKLPKLQLGHDEWEQHTCGYSLPEVEDIGDNIFSNMFEILQDYENIDDPSTSKLLSIIPSSSINWFRLPMASTAVGLWKLSLELHCETSDIFSIPNCLSGKDMKILQEEIIPVMSLKAKQQPFGFTTVAYQTGDSHQSIVQAARSAGLYTLADSESVYLHVKGKEQRVFHKTNEYVIPVPGGQDLVLVIVQDKGQERHRLRLSITCQDIIGLAEGLRHVLNHKREGRLEIFILLKEKDQTYHIPDALKTSLHQNCKRLLSELLNKGLDTIWMNMKDIAFGASMVPQETLDLTVGLWPSVTQTAHNWHSLMKCLEGKVIQSLSLHLVDDTEDHSDMLDEITANLPKCSFVSGFWISAGRLRADRAVTALCANGKISFHESEVTDVSNSEQLVYLLSHQLSNISLKVVDSFYDDLTDEKRRRCLSLDWSKCVATPDTVDLLLRLFEVHSVYDGIIKLPLCQTKDQCRTLKDRLCEMIVAHEGPSLDGVTMRFVPGRGSLLKFVPETQNHGLCSLSLRDDNPYVILHRPLTVQQELVDGRVVPVGKRHHVALINVYDTPNDEEKEVVLTCQDIADLPEALEHLLVQRKQKIFKLVVKICDDHLPNDNDGIEYEKPPEEEARQHLMQFFNRGLRGICIDMEDIRLSAAMIPCECSDQDLGIWLVGPVTADMWRSLLKELRGKKIRSLTVDPSDCDPTTLMDVAPIELPACPGVEVIWIRGCVLPAEKAVSAIEADTRGQLRFLSTEFINVTSLDQLVVLLGGNLTQASLRADPKLHDHLPPDLCKQTLALDWSKCRGTNETVSLFKMILERSGETDQVIKLPLCTKAHHLKYINQHILSFFRQETEKWQEYVNLRLDISKDLRSSFNGWIDTQGFYAESFVLDDEIEIYLSKSPENGHHSEEYVIIRKGTRELIHMKHGVFSGISNTKELTITSHTLAGVSDAIEHVLIDDRPNLVSLTLDLSKDGCLQNKGGICNDTDPSTPISNYNSDEKNCLESVKTGLTLLVNKDVKDFNIRTRDLGVIVDILPDKCSTLDVCVRVCVHHSVQEWSQFFQELKQKELNEVIISLRDASNDNIIATAISENIDLLPKIKYVRISYGCSKEFVSFREKMSEPEKKEKLKGIMTFSDSELHMLQELIEDGKVDETLDLSQEVRDHFSQPRLALEGLNLRADSVVTLLSTGIKRIITLYDATITDINTLEELEAVLAGDLVRCCLQTDMSGASTKKNVTTPGDNPMHAAVSQENTKPAGFIQDTFRTGAGVTLAQNIQVMADQQEQFSDIHCGDTAKTPDHDQEDVGTVLETLEIPLMGSELSEARTSDPPPEQNDTRGTEHVSLIREVHTMEAHRLTKYLLLPWYKVLASYDTTRLYNFILEYARETEGMISLPTCTSSLHLQNLKDILSVMMSEEKDWRYGCTASVRVSNDLIDMCKVLAEERGFEDISTETNGKTSILTLLCDF